jgi:hypothetical protein
MADLVPWKYGLQSFDKFRPQQSSWQAAYVHGPYVAVKACVPDGKSAQRHADRLLPERT